MTMKHKTVLASVAALVASLAAGQTLAQQAPESAPAAAPSPAVPDAAKPEPLVVYFDLGSATVRTQDLAVLDKASRLYTEAKPLVMIVSGATDATGPAQLNLDLSQKRAQAVLKGLVARGIPPERFQVLAKGGTEPTVATPAGVEEQRNRRVEIAWR